jgi:hypothetical protein
MGFWQEFTKRLVPFWPKTNGQKSPGFFGRLFRRQSSMLGGLLIKKHNLKSLKNILKIPWLPWRIHERKIRASSWRRGVATRLVVFSTFRTHIPLAQKYAAIPKSIALL